MHRSLPFGVLAACFVAPLMAQDWVKAFPTTTPPAITGHGLAYDVGNDRTVLFGGGVGGSARIDETWLFDGANWAQATPATAPPPRAGHPLAYDLIRGRVVLFGGIGVGTGVLNDTWEWDGTNWLQMAPATLPPARLSHPLVYHPGRGTCVVHGGNGLGAGTLTDTWEWNGINWVQIPTTSNPLPLRFAGDMAYDPTSNGLIFFGGYAANVPQSDTWHLNNTTNVWSQLTPATTPPGRWDHSMTTDPIRNRIVMFGGGPGSQGDTWEFDGTDWIQATPAHMPAGREDEYLAYDLVRGQVVMYGGSLRNDTWVYQTPPQPGFAAAIPYGDGCVDRASASVYETFAPNTFDLSNSTLTFLATGSGYALLYAAGAPQWFTPSNTVTLADEQVSGPQPLGFSLAYPGGTTTNVYISSNGFILAQPGGTPQCCTGSATGLVAGLPRWSPFWGDLNPAAGGSVYFDIDSGTQDAIVTFDQVPIYNQPAATQTFQVVFSTNGDVKMRFQTCGNPVGTYLTGWSPGGGVGNPGSSDLSAITAPIVTLPDTISLRHRSDLRPVVGNTLSLSTAPISAATVIAATVFGLTEHTTGIDLTAFGMPSCYQYASTDAVLVHIPAGGVVTGSFVVPNSPAFAGVVIKSQGAALVPGVNAAGAVTSNGMRMTIDIN